MITSRRNDRVKTIRRLRDCKDEIAILEGPRLVEEMVASGLEPMEVLATPEFLARPGGEQLARLLHRAPLEVSASVLASVTDAATPQGVLAVVELPRAGVEQLPLVDGGVYLFLDGLQNPGNLGALVRSAEATRVAGVVVTAGSAHPNHPKALRASGGSLLRIPIAFRAGLEETLDHLRPLGPRLLALEAGPGGVDLYEARLGGTQVLALGSEGRGLDPATSARADLRIRIPVAAPVESLNVTVAGSVVLYELARRSSGASSR